MNDKLRKNVDSLIVVNNNKLRDIYGNLGVKEGFSKADEVLATAAKGIAEVITHHYTQNIDLKDAKTRNLNFTSYPFKKFYLIIINTWLVINYIFNLF